MATRDTHSSYVDGIKVKISEQYKPPPRIILPVSYSQRLTLNDHIRKSMPQYDFNGERSIKSSIAEWKMARKLKQTERENNFEACGKEMVEIDEKVALMKECQLKKEQELDEVEKKATTTVTNMMLPSITTVRTTQHNILIPTIAGLNPQPHNSILDKSPFNVSDFDPDTSSPFDNMALKSINDLEELALVLNKDKGTISAKSQDSQQSNQQMNQQQTNYQMYSYNDQQNAALSSYSNRNGYYQHDLRTLSQPVNVNHSYSYPSGSYDQQHSLTATLPTSQSNVTEHHSTPKHLPKPPQQSSQQQQQQHRTVRSIQHQLDNTHLHHHLNTLPSSRTTLVSGGCGLASANAAALIGSNHSQRQRPHGSEQLGNPLGMLEADAQAMCREISSMGFPLARVARACDLIGNDDKKIVEYLLVMSDLMDLGFSETSVSTALVKWNNDKDKALEELLIL